MDVGIDLESDGEGLADELNSSDKTSSTRKSSDNGNVKEGMNSSDRGSSPKRDSENNIGKDGMDASHKSHSSRRDPSTKRDSENSGVGKDGMDTSHKSHSSRIRDSDKEGKELIDKSSSSNRRGGDGGSKRSSKDRSHHHSSSKDKPTSRPSGSRHHRKHSHHRSSDDGDDGKERRSSSRKHRSSHRHRSRGGAKDKDGGDDHRALKDSRHRIRRATSASGSDNDIEKRSSRGQLDFKRSSTTGGRVRPSNSGRYKDRAEETPEDRAERKEKEKRRHRERDHHHHRDRDHRHRDRSSRRDKDRKRETSEERTQRKQKEKEDREKDDKQKLEREERKEKERDQRRKEAEEKQQRRAKEKEERRKEKSSSKEASKGNQPDVMHVNRADLRQVSKEKFSNVYQLGKKIYEGEDTRVHLCNHWATGTERCVKITPKKSSENHEFTMLSNLDHPNTLTMYDLFAVESEIGFEWYLVIDLCKGGTLYNYLQKKSAKPKEGEQEVKKEEKPEDDDFLGLGGLVAAITGDVEEESDTEEGEFYGIDEEDVKTIMMQVMSCVNYLHKNRLVHADLKPQNILLSERKNLTPVKLVDFDNSALLRAVDDKINMKKGTPEYMAPEVHSGEKYAYKCDIWSCGVLTYELLSNSLPFGTEDECSEQEIAAKVKEGKFTMVGPAWGAVSSEAKDFIKSLLVLSERKRPSAEKVLQHKWLVGGSKKGGDNGELVELVTLSKDVGAKLAMANFRKFKADSKLKKATMTFIASQLLTKEEKDKTDTIFKAMNITRSGKMSKTEVKAGFFTVFNTFLSDKEIDEIFNRVDCDGTGEIEYSEFVVASMAEEDLLSTARLRKAFQLFDKDNGGSITIDELREIFAFFNKAGADLDDDYVEKIIVAIDADGTGDVSFEEFVEMMKNGVPDDDE